MKDLENTPSSLPPWPRGVWAKIGHACVITPRMPAVLFMRGYRQTVSKLYGNVCKYYPTCSKYALDAFEVKGLFVGMAMTVWRLLRCNPFSLGGVDYVHGSVLHERSLEMKRANNGTMVPDAFTDDASRSV